MNSGRRAIILLSAGLSALWAVAQAQAQSVETTSHILVSRASVGLTQPWLAPREELSMDALMRLLNVAHLDPALDAQVNGLMDSVGLTAETLLPLLHLCPPNDDQGTGEFHEPLIRRSIIAIDPLSPLGGPPRPLPWTADVIDTARNAPAGHTVETRTTTLGEVRSAMGLGTICIERSVADGHGRPQDITLFEAFTTFMHELTHVARWQRWLQDSLMEYESFDAFVDAELMRPGGEWEAYVAEGAAAARLMRQLPPGAGFVPALARYFDAEGQLTDAPGLRRFILAPLSAKGLGYREQFVEVFQGQVKNAVEATASNADLLSSALRAYSHNVAELTRVEATAARAEADEYRMQRERYAAHLPLVAADLARTQTKRCGLWRRYHAFYESSGVTWPDDGARALCGSMPGSL